MKGNGGFVCGVNEGDVGSGRVRIVAGYLIIIGASG